MHRLTPLLAMMAACLPLAAQPMPEVLLKHWKTSVAYTKAMAEKMPAEGYSFKPTPAEMSFGEQILHIASANALFVGALTGGKAPSWDSKKADRSSVLAALDESSRLVTATLEKITPDQLQKMLKTEEGEMRGVDLVMLMLDHTTHHRGQMVVYLRLKGIAPAEYAF